MTVISAVLAIAVVYSLDSRQRLRVEALDPFRGMPSHIQDLMRN